jgi:hypothetical protein
MRPFSGEGLEQMIMAADHDRGRRPSRVFK